MGKVSLWKEERGCGGWGCCTYCSKARVIRYTEQCYHCEGVGWGPLPSRLEEAAARDEICLSLYEYSISLKRIKLIFTNLKP